MKIFLDIGHPAHVHYFRNFIQIMKKKGHEFLITARDKDVTQYLLNFYKIPFISRGSGKKSLLGKLFYLFSADAVLFKEAKKFKPDLFLSFGSPYAAQVSNLLKIPHIAFDDTEHAIFEHMMYVPFTDVILTPTSFIKKFGSKHIFFDGTMDLCYLHPSNFSASDAIYNILNLNKTDKFIIMRFVSWMASHDIGQKRLSLKDKLFLVEELSKSYRIFISSENELPREWEKYKLKLPPELIHEALYYSSAYIGESTTMATEAATLGTIAYCSNSSTKHFGIFNEFYSKNLIKDINNWKPSDIVSYVLADFSAIESADSYKINHLEYIKDKIDVTSFMVWFVENYPGSFRIMKENPDYQYNFR